MKSLAGLGEERSTLSLKWSTLAEFLTSEKAQIICKLRAVWERASFLPLVV